jgi:adenosylhomocysteine nucleosidase
MTRTAIIAAMPGELKPLTRGWQHTHSKGVDLWSAGDCIAACAGAGVSAATRAFAEVEKLGPIDKVISTGWAGALRAEIESGQAYWVAGVLDARTGERFETADVLSDPSRKNKDAARVGHPGVDESPISQNREMGHPVVPFQSGLWLVTSATVAGKAEKQRLASTTPASLVDMEAAAIARLAAARGISFFCIKGISDGYIDQLPDFNRFILSDGRFHLARFVLFVLPRPCYWSALIRMGENSKKASCAIAASLFDLLGL